jgi:hypothetical protein
VITAGLRAQHSVQRILGELRRAQLADDRQRQRRRGCDRWGRIGIAAPRQDVEHDVAAEQPGCKRFRSVPSSWRPNGSEIGLT